jgi:hypothetical protein
MTETPKSLGDAFSHFTLKETFGWDFRVALLGAAGGAWLGVAAPALLDKEVPLAATVVGIIVGAVIAGVAVLAVFLDQAFLRKLRAIKREPVRYLSPFLFTAVLGVVASLLLLVVGGLPDSAPTWLRGTLAGLSGLAVTWTLTSIVPDLNLLVQFIGLQFDAADIPELPADRGDRGVR